MTGFVLILEQSNYFRSKMLQKAYFEIFRKSDTRTCFWQLIKWTGQSKNISKNTQQQQQQKQQQQQQQQQQLMDFENGMFEKFSKS